MEMECPSSWICTVHTLTRAQQWVVVKTVFLIIETREIKNGCRKDETVFIVAYTHWTIRIGRRAAKCRA